MARPSTGGRMPCGKASFPSSTSRSFRKPPPSPLLPPLEQEANTAWQGFNLDATPIFRKVAAGDVSRGSAGHGTTREDAPNREKLPRLRLHVRAALPEATSLHQRTGLSHPRDSPHRLLLYPGRPPGDGGTRADRSLRALQGAD